MNKNIVGAVVLSLAFLLVIGCTGPAELVGVNDAQFAARTANIGGGVQTANGWYEGEEIYYAALGVEEGVPERGNNDIYLIGGNRAYQAQVVLHIPGEPGYTPHWNVNLVNTADGITVDDIANSNFASDRFTSEGVLFDDVEDILGAQEAGLVTIVRPGVVVLCPIISEQTAEAPGNTQLSEDFPPFPETF
jgi:hypothetical protein